MEVHSSELVRLEVPCDSDAPCAIREALNEAFERAELPAALSRGAELRSDARLIASELVTNAVRYSGCGPQESISFSARIDGDALLIAVCDPGRTGEQARLREGNEVPPGGFGLRIVEELARRWGAERPSGQRVWAELALAGEPQ